MITAVDPNRDTYLPDVWASLEQQEMPTGWRWEWLVQCDSTNPNDRAAVRLLLPDDDRVSFGASRKGGPGIARTMALARATGSLVKTLDADDQLTAGALKRDIVAVTENHVAWVVSRVMDDHNGVLAPHYNIPVDPRPGRVRSGDVYVAYRDNYRMLVHPATLCVSYPLLVALGGWMALPASEDTGLLMALDACCDGWFNEEVGLLYRRWGPQMSASPAHADPEELAARRGLVTVRAEALSHLIAGR